MQYFECFPASWFLPLLLWLPIKYLSDVMFEDPLGVLLRTEFKFGTDHVGIGLVLPERGDNDVQHFLDGSLADVLREVMFGAVRDSYLFDNEFKGLWTD